MRVGGGSETKKTSIPTIIASFILASSLLVCVSRGKSMAPLPPPPPLQPILSDLKISPFFATSRTAPSGILHEHANKLGDDVTINFTITNTDNQSFVYAVTMQIGNITLMIDVELEAHESKTVSHTITPDAVGFYDVEVDGLTGCFYVWPHEEKPAEFVVSDLNLITEIEEGADITIFVNVSNVGDIEGSHQVDLILDGGDILFHTVYSKNVTLPGGASEEVPICIEGGLTAGTYQVEVEGLTGSFTVAPKPSFWDEIPGFTYESIILGLLFGVFTIWYQYRGVARQDSAASQERPADVVIFRGSNWLRIFVVVLSAGTIAVSGLYFVRERERYFDLKDRLENISTEFNRLQVELAETTAEYEALQQSYRELEEEFEDLEAKHLDFVRVYKLKYFTYSNLTITPEVIELGQSVTISFCITNVHHEPHIFGIATLIEGPDWGVEIMDSITVGGYETKKISYIEFPDVVGNFTVTIGGLTGFFVVTQASEG